MHMYSHMATLLLSILPILALIFATALFAYKVYINIRSRYNAKVNCWFCNVDTSVPFLERNSWTCKHCDQYNGFTKDGDYNRDILPRAERSNGNGLDKSGSSIGVCANAFYTDAPDPPALNNGLCDQCNNAQRLKVEKLAQFEPKYESRFEAELKILKDQLEKQFRLCNSCETHVQKVLSEKKKMVLGSKFLNFIIKGAALLKQPHFNRLATMQQQLKLQRYQYLMTFLTLLNICCLLYNLPPATQEHFNALFGQTMAWPIFMAYSHLVTFVRVFGTYLSALLEHKTLTKLLVYARTFGKMLLYSMGLTQMQVANATLSTCFSLIYPYLMLALNFLHNITNALKITRFTLLLVLWSICAQYSMLPFEIVDLNNFTLLSCIITLALLATNRSNSLLHTALDASSAGSFHKLYADDCFSDEDSISILSQQLDCSGSLSMQSSSSNTLRQPSIAPAPSVLSLDSLRLSNRHKPAPPNSYLASSLTNRQANIQRFSRSNQSLFGQGADYWHTQRAMPSASETLNNSFTSPTSWSSTFGGYAGAQRVHSPFSVSTNAVHQQHRTPIRDYTPVLLPSKLGSNTLNKNGDISAWVASAFVDNSDMGYSKDMHTAGITRHEDKLSRTSSQSSGFESQQGPNAHQFESPTPQYFKRLWNQPYNGSTVQQRQVAPPLNSPFSEQSELQFGRDHTNTIKPGDLLRKWIERSAGQSVQSIE